MATRTPATSRPPTMWGRPSPSRQRQRPRPWNSTPIRILGYFRLDDVSLTPNAAATPEPSTMLPAAIASLLGLGYAWRRRQA
jgi:PEP-CTERM motif